MAGIKLDEEKLLRIASEIEVCNNRIRDEYADVETSMQKLDGAWNGSAADHALATFYSIKERYGDPRWEIMQSYVELMRVPVYQGYTETEKANTSLADAFL